MMEEIFGGIFGFIFVIGTFMLLFAGIKWIMAKYFGTNLYSRGSAKQAYQDEKFYAIEFHRLSRENPLVLEKAVQRCKQKKYSTTHYNVVCEVDKILKEETGEPTAKNKVVGKLKLIADSFKTDNLTSKIDRLEKLNKLKKDGVLSNEEFEALKKDVIK